MCSMNKRQQIKVLKKEVEKWKRAYQLRKAIDFGSAYGMNQWQALELKEFLRATTPSPVNGGLWAIGPKFEEW